MRILGYCLLATYLASWPLVDSAFLSRTRPPTAAATEESADWIGYADHASVND